MSSFHFVLLGDPQQGEINKDPATEVARLQTCSDVNNHLNNLDPFRYPAPGPGMDISLSGKIAQPSCIFIAGDLTQYGGLYNGLEQSNLTKNPSNYLGGKQLTNIHRLYNPGAKKDQVQPYRAGPIYFGLGNHDFDSDFKVGWRKFDGTYTGKNEASRYQSWNFINQMHRGYADKTYAPFPIDPSNIDVPARGSYEWKNYSFNYMVDMGPVDVYQLHRFGGDYYGGRKTGLNWLKHKLATRGYARPVIIVQHFPWSAVNDEANDWASWKTYNRRLLMEVLLPYNVIAMCCGHLHNQQSLPTGDKWVCSNDTSPPTLSPSPPTRQIDEILPGAAHNGYFGLLHGEKVSVTDTETNKLVPQLELNVMYANIYGRPGKQFLWSAGWKKNFAYPAPLYVRAVHVLYLDHADDENHPELPMLCTEMSAQSPDINRGHGGKFVYLRPLLTSDPSQAISGLGLNFESKSDSGPNIMQGSGNNAFASLVDQTGGTPITGLFLLRSSTPTDYRSLSGFAGQTENINQRRGGDYLYLVWRTWVG